MRILSRVSLGVLFVLAGVSCTTIGSATDDVRPPYRIDHELRPAGDLAPVAVDPGQTIDFQIENTDPGCFQYNFRTEGNPDLLPESGGTRETVHLHALHDESIGAYIIDVTLRQNADARCTSAGLTEKTWRVPVQSLWNVAAAGGFAFHDLVNPVFFLEPHERPKSDGSGTESGYIIRRQAENEDDHPVVGAGMVHFFRSGKGWRGLSLAPLSFGLGTESGRSEYLIGTSIRLGTRAYLTVGRISGAVKRLPNGKVLDTFTTDANAIADASLPTRREDAWFASVSFGFLNAGVSNLFKNKLGMPTPVNTGGGGGSGGGNAPDEPQPVPPNPTPETIVAAPATGPAGTTVVLRSANNALAPRDNSSIVFKNAAGDQVHEIEASQIIDQWSAERVTFAMPAVPAGAITIEVILEGTTPAATSTFTVTAQ